MPCFGGVVGVFRISEGKDMRKEWQQVIGIMSVWILAALIAWILFPADWKWVAWIPVGLIILSLIIAGIGILRLRLTRPPSRVQIDGKIVTRCLYCPRVLLKDNPVNKNYPIFKCSENKLHIILNAHKIPQWCPYAIKC